MRGDLWGQFMDKRIVDCVHHGAKSVEFSVQFREFFFQLFDLITDSRPLFAWRARSAFQYNTGYLLVFTFDLPTTTA